MKKGKKGLMLATALTLIAAATLCLYPTFRTSAQTKDKPAAAKKQGPNDASRKPAPKRSGSKMGDVDQKDIDKAMLEVEQSMRELKEQDLPKMQAEIEKAMKEIDAEKISKQVQEAMKQVDMSQIQAEISKAMAEVQANLKEIDAEKIRAEAISAIKQIDMKAIEKEVAEAKKINTEQIKKQMAEAKEQMIKAKLEMKDAMENAGEQVKAAQKQLQLLRQGLDELEKDGLKKKGEKVNIEYKDGILYLNGNAQSKEVSDKYQKYFGNGSFNFSDDNHDDETSQQNKESVK